MEDVLFKQRNALTLAIVLGLTLSTTPVIAKSPKPSLAEIKAAKKEEAAKKAKAKSAAEKLAAASQTLRTLTAKANAAQVLYSKARQELTVASSVAKTAANHARKTKRSVLSAHQVIGKMALSAYIMGGSLTEIEPLLSSDGPQELIDQITTLDNLGTQNVMALDRYKAAEVIARDAQTQADEAKVAQETATAKVADAKKVADDARAMQQKEVEKLQAIQDKLAKDLASAKKVRITLEQQRALALLEESLANTATTTTGQKKVWSDTGFKGRSTIRTTEAQRAVAVAFAKKQVIARKPYIWGSEGPNSFDCSGLVYAAYRSAGLGWPNWDRLNSSLYAGYTKHVSLDALVPGDLLFYSHKGTISSIHHITIYAGNGMMWEANSKDRGLLYSNIYSVKGLMPFGGRV